LLRILEDEFRLAALGQLRVHATEVLIDRGEDLREPLFLLVRELVHEVDQLLALSLEPFELVLQLDRARLLRVVVLEGPQVDGPEGVDGRLALRDRRLQFLEAREPSLLQPDRHLLHDVFGIASSLDRRPLNSSACVARRLMSSFMREEICCGVAAITAFFRSSRFPFNASSAFVNFARSSSTRAAVFCASSNRAFRSWRSLSAVAILAANSFRFASRVLVFTSTAPLRPPDSLISPSSSRISFRSSSSRFATASPCACASRSFSAIFSISLATLGPNLTVDRSMSPPIIAPEASISSPS